MRRKDRERDAAFAWEVMRSAPYVTVSMVDNDGTPYAVPVSQGVWEEKNAIYFHCAFAGRKYDLFRDGCPAVMSAVSRVETLPTEYTVAYASAIARGWLEIVTDETERMQAMERLCRQFGADAGEGLADCMGKIGAKTCLARLSVEKITGKEKTE